MRTKQLPAKAFDWYLPIWLGDVKVLISQNEVVVNDEVRRLQPKAMAVLRILIEADGNVVTKEVLMDRVWPNMMVAERVLVDAIYQLRRTLGDDARSPRFIRTISRSGYCLVAQVSVDLSAGSSRALVSEAPCIVVTEFKGLGPDLENCDFCEGLTEDLIHHIGQLSGLEVLGTISSLDDLSLGIHPMRQIARLGATHLIGGSVRQHSGRLRIITRLLDTQSETLLWSGVYDRELTDVLDIQLEVAKSISEELASHLASWPHGQSIHTQ